MKLKPLNHYGRSLPKPCELHLTVKCPSHMSSLELRRDQIYNMREMGFKFPDWKFKIIRDGKDITKGVKG